MGLRCTQPPLPFQCRIAGCQVGCELGELGCRRRRSASPRLLGGRVEVRGGDGVGTIDGQRHVARPLLDVGDRPCERSVNRTALPDRSLLVADRREQGMSEAETRVVELHHSLPRGGIERLDDGLTMPVCLDHELDRRAGERRCEEDDVARVGREPGEATPEKLVQAVGHGQRPARGRPGARADELAPELECEERVARRRLLNPDELGPGQIETDSLPQQVVERPHAQWADREPLEPIRSENAIELDGDGCLGSRPHGREHADTLVPQAAESDLQDTGR